MDGVKEKRKATGEVVREVKGNLRFPLDKTYHGCPQVAAASRFERVVRLEKF